jgi:hypothetical protein
VHELIPRDRPIDPLQERLDIAEFGCFREGHHAHEAIGVEDLPSSFLPSRLESTHEIGQVISVLKEPGALDMIPQVEISAEVKCRIEPLENLCPRRPLHLLDSMC